MVRNIIDKTMHKKEEPAKALGVVKLPFRSIRTIKNMANNIKTKNHPSAKSLLIY